MQHQVYACPEEDMRQVSQPYNKIGKQQVFAKNTANEHTHTPSRARVCVVEAHSEIQIESESTDRCPVSPPLPFPLLSLLLLPHVFHKIPLEDVGERCKLPSGSGRIPASSSSSIYQTTSTTI